MRGWVGLLVAAVLAVGCHSDDGGEREGGPGGAAQPGQAAGSGGTAAAREGTASTAPCDLFLRDHGVFIRFAGERANRECATWRGARGAGGGRWARSDGAAASQRFARACVVYRG